jgi:hypothetical protein
VETRYTQKALDETPDLPSNEYKRWGCPLECESIRAQTMNYIHWDQFGNNERVSREEIDQVIKTGFEQSREMLWDIIIKYQLKWNDWIWNAIAIGWDYEGAFELEWR